MGSDDGFERLWTWAVLVLLSVVFWTGFVVIGRALWQVLS